MKNINTTIKNKKEKSENKENRENKRNGSQKKKDILKRTEGTIPTGDKQKNDKETKKRIDLEKRKKNRVKSEEPNLNKNKSKNESENYIKTKNNSEIKKKIISKNTNVVNQLPSLITEMSTKEKINAEKSHNSFINALNIQIEKETENIMELDLVEEMAQLLFINSFSVIVKKEYFFLLLQKYISTKELLGIKNALVEYKHEDLLILKKTKNIKKQYAIVTNLDTYYYYMKKNKTVGTDEEIKDEKEKPEQEEIGNVEEGKEQKLEQEGARIEQTEEQKEKVEQKGTKGSFTNTISSAKGVGEFNYVFIQPKTYISVNEEEIRKEIMSYNITENRKKIKNYVYINKNMKNSNESLDMVDQTQFVSFKNETPKETQKDQTIDFFSNNSATLKESNTQTHLPIYKTVGTQYSIDFLKKKKEEIIRSNKLKNFLNSVLPTVEKALIENLIISQKEEQKREHYDPSTSKKKNYLKKLFIYTDVKYTTDKVILFILRMSAISHIIFIVYINSNKYENYVEGVNTYSYILIWHYHNYINPIYAFISPYQITSAIIKENGDNLIIAGCSNGMLVIWKFPPDFSEKVNVDTKINEKTIDVEPFLFSNIELTHKREVTSLVLLNDKTLHLCDKKVAINNQDNSYLLVSISVDSTILLWDVTNVETAVPVVKTKKKIKEPIDELYCFKPLLKINATKPNADYSLGFIYFHFLEVTNNIASFFAFSEEGEYVLGDMYGFMHKEQKYSIVNTINDEYKNFKTLLCVKRNKLLKFLILSLTDTNFYLWKEDEMHPLFISPRSNEIYSCCEFSSSKIGVVFIGKLNGQIEIWNLIEQKNHYISSITISSYSLTCISTFENLNDHMFFDMNKKRKSLDDSFRNFEEFKDTNEYLVSKNEEDIYKYTHNKIIIGDSSGCVFVYEIKNNILISLKEEEEEYMRWIQNRVLINKQKVKRQQELSLVNEKGLNEKKRLKERKEQLRIRLDEDYKYVLEKYKNYLTGDSK